MNNKLKATIQYILDIKQVEQVTPKKLQNLLYYAQSWHLAFTTKNNMNKRIKPCLLFDAEFEAWANGPTIVEVYECYKEHGNDPLTTSGFKKSYLHLLTDKEQTNIDEVLDIYGLLTERQLNLLIQTEDPWLEARNGLQSLQPSHKTISYGTVRNYYSEKLIQPN